MPRVEAEVQGRFEREKRVSLLLPSSLSLPVAICRVSGVAPAGYRRPFPLVMGKAWQCRYCKPLARTSSTAVLVCPGGCRCGCR